MINMDNLKESDNKRIKRLISREWISNDSKWSLPNTDYKNLKTIEAVKKDNTIWADELEYKKKDNTIWIEELGYKICYEQRGFLYNRRIHPVSGRVYRLAEAITIAKWYNNDDEEFYKNTDARIWPKIINMLLEKESVVIKEDDIFSYGYKKNGYNEPEKRKYFFFIKPRPIEWNDLLKSQQLNSYWKRKFRRKK